MPSLKALHVLFVFLATIFAMVVGLYALGELAAGAGRAYLMIAVLSLSAAIALVVYGGFYLIKYRDSGWF
ncbi:MAG: hypothetical protein AAGD38_08565 [Acidobacteriota bacterium]